MSLCGCIMYVFGCPQTSGEGVHVRRDTDKLCLVDDPSGVGLTLPWSINLYRVLRAMPSCRAASAFVSWAIGAPYEGTYMLQ